MASAKNKKPFIEKAAEFIVDKRKLIYILYAILAVCSLLTMNLAKVNNDLTDYLSEDTETRQGISIMKREFANYASAEIMIDNISFNKAEALADDISKIDGVKQVDFDNTESHYAGASAMLSITFDYTSDDLRSSETLNKIREYLSEYDAYVSAELGDTKSNNLQKEMGVVIAVAAIVIVSVLLFTSKTYMEIPVLIITFLSAALLNKGSNFFLGTISFVSNSVTVVLQLALAIDYAIILCHRYLEERETKDARSAVVIALCKSVPEIAGSCLTTLAGLTAMTFMHFKIGFDMGIVLIKAIVISIICVFTLMPGLLMTFSKLIDKTHHKNFVPKINTWGRIVVKLRYIAPAIFAALLVISYILSHQCPYVYSTSGLATIKKSESQIASEMIESTFKKSNTVAILVPTGEYDKEKALLKELDSYDKVLTTKGLANVEAMDGYAIADKLNPRQFSELADVDIEKAQILYSAYAVENEQYSKILNGIDAYYVPLIDMFEYLSDSVNNGAISLGNETDDKIKEIGAKLADGKSQLKGENYSRLVMTIDFPEESPETYAFLDTIRNTAKKYYGDNVYLVGNSTNNFDLSSTFSQDNLLISILSILFVMLVLLLTFKSYGLPIILILVIQGSIWFNFSFPTIRQVPMFFLSYLVVSSIQMGANIDYAIVITNRFLENRRILNSRDAVIEAISQSFPTIITSGTILASAGVLVGLLSSEPSISSLGMALGRGTVISILLVMLILPELLMLGDKLIKLTTFDLLSSTDKTKSENNDTEVLTVVNGGEGND